MASVIFDPWLGYVDSLIVGAPFLDPWTVVEKLLPLLAPSAPFVIYHPYLQVHTLGLCNLILDTTERSTSSEDLGCAQPIAGPFGASVTYSRFKAMVSLCELE